MRYLNLLHLSDLHLKPADTVDRYNQSLILQGLQRSLRAVEDSEYRPDLMIFSGDLVNAADDNLFSEVQEQVEAIAAAVSLDLSRVIICPGNHDTSRNAIGPAIPAIQNFRDQANTIDGVNGLALNNRFLAHVGNVFGSFDTLYKRFGRAEEVSGSFLSRTYLYPRLSLGVVSVNTASLSGAGLTPDLKDERRLAIPELILDRALQAIPDGLLKVVVGHHPMAYLNETNETIVRALLQKHAAMYFSGHLHRSDPQFITAPQGHTSYIQAGSLYATRQWWNGYGIVSIDPANPRLQRVLYKRWHEERREFGTATEFSDDGIVFSGEDARAHWATIKPRVSPRTWERWRLDRLLPAIQQECSKDLSRVFEEGRFIQPDFEKDRYVTTDQGLERAAHPTPVQLDEIVSSHENLVILAPSESGKTTLIREWARRLASISALEREWQIPVILKFSELKSYIGQIERVVRQRLPELPSGVTAMELLETGRLIILVDDVKLAQLREKGGLSDFIKEYPANRYVLLTSSVYLQGAGIAPIIVDGVPFEHVRSKQLRTSQVLALIESHGTTDPTQADRLLQRMMVEASSLNVPITPVTGSFLIQIYTEDNATSLVNKANLLERYIEISLEKFAPADLLPSSFDFRNKTDLLSFLAEKMARAGAYQAPEADFVSWVNEYLAEYGLRFSTLDLVEYFVQARVLERTDGYVSFRLNAFFEYFTAVRIAEDTDFKDYVLGEDNYLRFPNEISFYAAISRKDVSWLNELLSRFEAHSADAKGQEQTVNAAKVLESFQLPQSSASVQDLRELEDKAFNQPMSEAERREALDDDVPTADLPEKPAARPSAPDVGQRWMAQLTMLSAMLKNMELVPSEKKSIILSRVLEAWLEFIAMSMRMVPLLAEQRRLRFAGVEYVVVYPENMDAGDLAQRLYMYMPISTAKVVSYHLGTEKLRVQLEAGIGTTGRESAAAQFLRGAILAQLGVDGLPEILQNVAQALAGKRYLQEVLFRLLAEVVVRYRLPEAERQKIKALAADVRVQLEGEKGDKAKRRKASIMRAMDSSRLKVQLLLREPAR